MQPMYYILLLITSMLWGGNFVSGKFLVPHASPLLLTELRWVIAVLCLLPYVWWKEKSLSFPKQALWPLILMGLTGVLLFNFFLFLALDHTSADNVGLLSTLNPISIAIASFFLLKERLNKQQIMGMVLSLGGVLIVMTHGDISRVLHLHFNIGDVYMIIAVIIWGLYSIASKKAMEYVSPFKSTLWSGIFGVFMTLPFTLSSMTIQHAGTHFYIALLYSSVGATALATILWNIGVQKVGGTKSGIFLNFNPIFTAILAFFLLGETLNTAQLFGSILVIGGVYLFTVKPLKRAKRTYVHSKG
ncbi:DMT family transporter [Priestia abyssalis]|uniref:DMT family transporter n=1 Tax=Priestia abyssalis TaxID=1221450 RepID=UPI000995A762|nr:DMT family transporter [Priestia abyssalis]